MPGLTMTYVADAYCGWCYGFSSTITALVQRLGDGLDLRVLSGSLFSGAPLSAMPYIEQANQRITQLTGAQFGPGFAALLADGSFEMNSDDAARGLVALCDSSEPGGAGAVQALSQMQKAFYLNGSSLSQAQTYAELAKELDLDAATVLARFGAADTAHQARRLQAQAVALGVTSYPTLLLHTERGLMSIAQATDSVDVIMSRLS